jgi:uncharacterized RDD family membrane protein YckC
MNYYVNKDGQKSGPFTEEKLKELVACGLLNAKDKCWREGSSNWIPLLQAFAGEPHLPRVDAPPEFAGFWRRFGAHIVDMVIVNIGVAAFTYGIFWVALAMDPDSYPNLADRQKTFNILAPVFCFFLPWLYYSLLESHFTRATVGKRIFGFCVTDMSGQQITFFRASIRYWGMILSVLTLFIGFFMCAWTKRRQCLHDMISGCLLPIRG